MHAHTRIAFPSTTRSISQPSCRYERAMLARYYTLSSEDPVLIRRHRRSHNKLGFAVQLAYLRFPGRTWTASEEPSPLVVSYIANQLKVNPMGIVQYAAEREPTRFEHLAELQHAPTRLRIIEA